MSYLETELDAVSTTSPNPGRTDTFRRLTRTEYRNAIRDLLALDVDVASLLPRDDASFGFDNVGVVELSPTLMERYLGAAQKISRLAVGSMAIVPGSRVVTMRPDITQEGHLAGLPFGTRGGTQVAHTFPLDGEYEIEVRLARNRNENVEGLRETHVLEMTLDGTRLELFNVICQCAPVVDQFIQRLVVLALQRVEAGEARLFRIEALLIIVQGGKVAPHPAVEFIQQMIGFKHRITEFPIAFIIVGQCFNMAVDVIQKGLWCIF